MKNYSEDPTRQYHIQVAPGEIGRYVLLPGDPGRVELIASFLDDAHEVAYNREFKTWTGYLDGEKVSVCSTGIGGPSAAIAVQELYNCGADTFIRIGTCGGMQLDVKSGDIVIGTSSIHDGSSAELVDIAYPAVADFEVTQELVRAAETLGISDGVHVGTSQSKCAFYGQHEPEKLPSGERLQEKWREWIRMGCLASEMESATIFVIAGYLRARAGACFLVVANQERELRQMDNPVVHDTSLAAQLGVEAIRSLIVRDRRDAVKSFIANIAPERFIIDFDGTIAFTEGLGQKSFAKYLESFGVNDFTDWHWKKMIGHTDDEMWDMVREYFPDADLQESNKELIAHRQERFLEMATKEGLAPNEWLVNACELITPDNSSIVSNNAASVIERALALVSGDIRANIGEVLSCADLGVSKLELWERAARGVEFSKVIVCEDNPSYIETAINIGYNVIAVKHDLNAKAIERIASEYADATNLLVVR